MGLLLDGVNDLVTADMGVAEVLNAFLFSPSPRRSTRPLCLEKLFKEENCQL